MTEEDAFHTFLSKLQPHLQEHIGVRVQGDLDAAIAMAQRLDVYCGGDGAKANGSGKDSKKYRNQIRKRVICRKSRGARLGGPSTWSKW